MGVESIPKVYYNKTNAIVHHQPTSVEAKYYGV